VSKRQVKNLKNTTICEFLVRGFRCFAASPNFRLARVETWAILAEGISLRLSAHKLKGNEMLYDIVIRNGTVYDGSGSPPYSGEVAIQGDTIAAAAHWARRGAGPRIDAGGLAVTPGFINMLSWAGVSLIADGRSQGDIRQGVTLEVMGEGWSMGPLNEAMKREMIERQGDIH